MPAARSPPATTAPQSIGECVRPTAPVANKRDVGHLASLQPAHRTRRPSARNHSWAGDVGVGGQPFLRENPILGGPYQVKGRLANGRRHCDRHRKPRMSGCGHRQSPPTARTSTGGAGTNVGVRNNPKRMIPTLAG